MKQLFLFFTLSFIVFSSCVSPGGARRISKNLEDNRKAAKYSAKIEPFLKKTKSSLDYIGISFDEQNQAILSVSYEDRKSFMDYAEDVVELQEFLVKEKLDYVQIEASNDRMDRREIFSKSTLKSHYDCKKTAQLFADKLIKGNKAEILSSLKGEDDFMKSGADLIDYIGTVNKAEIQSFQTMFNGEFGKIQEEIVNIDSFYICVNDKTVLSIKISYQEPSKITGVDLMFGDCDSFKKDNMMNQFESTGL